jgi:hypothetical protein
MRRIIIALSPSTCRFWPRVGLGDVMVPTPDCVAETFQVQEASGKYYVVDRCYEQRLVNTDVSGRGIRGEGDSVAHVLSMLRYTTAAPSTVVY